MQKNIWLSGNNKLAFNVFYIMHFKRNKIYMELWSLNIYNFMNEIFYYIFHYKANKLNPEEKNIFL